MLKTSHILEFSQMIPLQHQQILAIWYNLRMAGPRRDVQHGGSIAVMSGEKAHRASASVLAHQMPSPFPKPDGRLRIHLPAYVWMYVVALTLKGVRHLISPRGLKEMYCFSLFSCSRIGIRKLLNGGER